MISLTVLQCPGQDYWLEIETTDYLIGKHMKEATPAKTVFTAFQKGTEKKHIGRQKRSWWEQLPRLETCSPAKYSLPPKLTEALLNESATMVTPVCGCYGTSISWALQHRVMARIYTLGCFFWNLPPKYLKWLWWVNSKWSLILLLDFTHLAMTNSTQLTPR